MERLTVWAEDQNGQKVSRADYNPLSVSTGTCIYAATQKEQEIINRLAAYEDTGLTPEEIAYVHDTLVKAADVVEELLGKTKGKVTRNKGGASAV